MYTCMYKHIIIIIITIIASIKYMYKNKLTLYIILSYIVKMRCVCSRSEKLHLLGKSPRRATTESDNHTMTHSHSRPGLAERDVPALSTSNSAHFCYVSARLLCI